MQLGLATGVPRRPGLPSRPSHCRLAPRAPARAAAAGGPEEWGPRNADPRPFLRSAALDSPHSRSRSFHPNT
jgi:hypothetical protein